MVERVGFIGLGSIGEPMATNLCDRFETVVYDLSDAAVGKLTKAGASAAASSREVGERCEVIGVCVVDDASTEAVIAGEDGVLEGAKPGTVVMIHSTIHPDTAKRMAERGREQGVHVVDAQMTGGPGGAANRALRFMVGGEEEALQQCRPVLEALASKITHCGEIGMGAVAKLCNNLVQFTAWQAYVDGFQLAEHAGLSIEVLTDILDWIMNDNARLFMSMRKAREDNPENTMLAERFDAAMMLAEKDLALALDLGRTAGINMPSTGLSHQLVARLFGNPDLDRR